MSMSDSFKHFIVFTNISFRFSILPDSFFSFKVNIQIICNFPQVHLEVTKIWYSIKYKIQSLQKDCSEKVIIKHTQRQTEQESNKFDFALSVSYLFARLYIMSYFFHSFCAFLGAVCKNIQNPMIKLFLWQTE